MNTSLYIPDEQKELFFRAKKELGDSISATFLRCLKRELELKKLKTERIVIDVADDNERKSRVAFEGRWLIGNAEKPEHYEFTETEASHQIMDATFEGYSVAITKKEQFFVLLHFRHDDYPKYRVVESIEDMERGDDPPYPSSLCNALRVELGEEPVVQDLDI